MEKAIGVLLSASCRPTARHVRGQAARAEAMRSATVNARRGSRGIFDLMCNYNEPGIGHDLIAVLDHNEFRTCPWKELRGMPKLSSAI